MISRVKKVGWYSVAADEVTDISNKEQLIECDTGIFGRAIADKIISCLQALVRSLQSAWSGMMEQVTWLAQSIVQQLSSQQITLLHFTSIVLLIAST